MDLSWIPWVEVLRFVLLAAAAGFSFLSWRWYQLDSRRVREELLRNRYVNSSLLYRLPRDTKRSEPHTRFEIFRVRVNEHDGFRNLLNKILYADFEGTTEVHFAVTRDLGEGSVPRRIRELPDGFEEITENERFSDMGLEEENLKINGPNFNIEFPTADPDEIDQILGQFVVIIEEVCFEEEEN